MQDPPYQFSKHMAIFCPIHEGKYLKVPVDYFHYVLSTAVVFGLASDNTLEAAIKEQLLKLLSEYWEDYGIIFITLLFLRSNHNTYHLLTVPKISYVILQHRTPLTHSCFAAPFHHKFHVCYFYFTTPTSLT